MSFISLQFGQCGNQVGHAFYKTIQEDIKNKSNSYTKLQTTNKWFSNVKKDTNKWEPRAILIDTESKVINSTQSDGIFKFNNIILKSIGGSANNWAYGYNDTSKLIINDALSCIRSEIERCDYLTSFLNFYSLSGGTGSGVGSSVITRLRDEYSKKLIVNCAILPHLKGEIATQSYNCLLNLAHLYSVADCTILFENDRLIYANKYYNGLTDCIQFNDLNQMISVQLASVFQTSNTWKMFSELTASDAFKYLRIETEPHNSQQKFACNTNWKSLFNSLIKQNRYDLEQMKNLKHKIISSALVTHSSGGGVGDVAATSLCPKKENYVSWLPKSQYFKQYHQNEEFLGHTKHLALISNCNKIWVPLNALIEDAWTMFTHGAYLHHYKKYGIEENDFLQSFQIMENILENYKTI